MTLISLIQHTTSQLACECFIDIFVKTICVTVQVSQDCFSVFKALPYDKQQPCV